MAILTASFGQGTNGNTIASTDLGNQDAWDTVTIGGTGTFIYDNTHANSGSLAAKVTSTAGKAEGLWSTAFGTQTDHYGRVYCYFTANPAVAVQLVRANNGAATLAGLIQVNTTGVVRCVAANATFQAGTVGITLNQWIRIEYHIIHSTPAGGTVEAKLFNTATSTTPDETITYSNQGTSAQATQISFGNDATNTPGAFWMDDIVANATAYPGPLANYTKGFLGVV